MDRWEIDEDELVTLDPDELTEDELAAIEDIEQIEEAYAPPTGEDSWLDAYWEDRLGGGGGDIDY